MIKGIRRNFIKITMTMLTLVLIIPLAALNIITAVLTYNSNKQLLNQIAQNEIHIISPQNNKHNGPPPDENFVGVGKQQHTTPPLSSFTTTTTSPASTINTTVTTTVKAHSHYNDNESKHTSPTKISDTDIQTTVPESTGTLTSIIINSRTIPPQPPDWGNARPQPPIDPEPNVSHTRPPKPDFWEPVNSYTDKPWNNFYNDYGAVMISPVNINLIALNVSASFTSSSTTTTTTTNVTIPTNASSDVPEPNSESKQRVIAKKQFNREFIGHKPPDMNSSNTIDHFIVYLNKDGVVTDVHGTDDYSIQNCTELIENINKSSKIDGYYNSLQYVKKNYTEGSIVVFSNRKSDIDMMKKIFFVSIGVFVLMEGIVFILTRILTQRAMRPMQISYEKQQQFISDAGHELKTPLTVISANADILFDEIGENKWLSYIKSQTERMRILVQEMLDLTKFSYTEDHIAQSRFNISSLIENVALPFECQAFEQKKNFHIEIEPNIEFLGNTERIRRMVSIFIDNAFKYSNESGTIKIQLKTENGKKILSIYNTGIGIEKGEEEKIFERFYRSDSSRSVQGGYGLGLAIAKSIADQHDIKIQVQTEPGQWISFNLTL